jgi:hypothetical protein
LNARLQQLETFIEHLDAHREKAVQWAHKSNKARDAGMAPPGSLAASLNNALSNGQPVYNARSTKSRSSAQAPPSLTTGSCSSSAPRTSVTGGSNSGSKRKADSAELQDRPKQRPRKSYSEHSDHPPLTVSGFSEESLMMKWWRQKLPLSSDDYVDPYTWCREFE